MLESHPPAVYLREDPIKYAVNDWLGGLFRPENVDATAAALAGTDRESSAPGRVEAVKKRLADAEARVRRLQDAISAGVDPAALVEAINQAQADRAAAQAELASTPTATAADSGQVYAMIDSLGDVGSKLAGGKTDSLVDLYDDLDLQVRYEPENRVAFASIQPRIRRVNSACVRRGV